jgi:hypothetical protein
MANSFLLVLLRRFFISSDLTVALLEVFPIVRED